MRPNYFVIGAQKSGTSSLCYLLGQHPDVFMTEPKEPYFFSDEEIWSRGFEWYESLFENAQSCAAVGEGSTTYSMNVLYPKAPGRIHDYAPDARLIYIVRNPLDRMVSHWLHLRARGGRETRPFPEAIRARPDYIDNSRYLKQIDIYRRLWPDERILVLFFDDLVADQEAVMRRCFEFLGVDPHASPRRISGERNRSEGSREDTSIASMLRRMPLFDHLRESAPESLRDSLRRILKRPAQRPTWDQKSRAWAIEQLNDESREFLRRYGKPVDYWDLEAPEPAT